MSVILPGPCECGAEGSDLVVTDLPNGWQKMDNATRDYFTVVRCGGCKNILKYYGTMRCYGVPGFDWKT